jgi:hypothetical protein
MGSSELVHQADGTDNNDQAITAEDRKLLDQLGELWRSHAVRDLRTRHETGRLLNERFGPPTESQPQGKRVIQKASEELAISMSDISRMRNFAFHFSDVAALQQAHPEATNWTRLKEVLPSLTPDKGGDAKQPAESPSRPATRGIAKAITSLTSMLNRLENPPVGAERARLLADVQELAEAVSDHLKIRVKVAVRVKDSKPVATKRLDRVA